jgi:branched-chain amino acid transport system permease protein
MPTALRGAADVGVWIGLAQGAVTYPMWRLVYFLFSAASSGGVRLPALHHLRHGGPRRHGRPRDGGAARHQYRSALHHHVRPRGGRRGSRRRHVHAAPAAQLHQGMDFLVLSFVVVVVGGMGSLPGAVAAGFLLGILQSFASMNEIKQIIPGIDQIIIYLTPW